LVADVEACIVLNCLFWTSQVVNNFSKTNCVDKSYRYTILEGHSLIVKKMKADI
jgi:hypothetical protein